MASPSARDRVLTLAGTPEQLAEVTLLLSAPTRLAILRALRLAGEALNINEVARRVGVDASPVRTHLELLAKAGFVEEGRGRPGRERRFTTRLKDVRVQLESLPRAPAADGTPPKTVARLEKKLEGVEKEMAKLNARAQALHRQIDAAWTRAPAAPKASRS